jgi:spore germination cell wall hydrolase CwlJ-like protein
MINQLLRITSVKRLYGALAFVVLLTPALLPLERLARPVVASSYLAEAPAPTPIIAAASDLAALVATITVIPGPTTLQDRCLAQAVYFEARSEPLEGQLAVAQVVLNRVKDARYPSTTCDVVFQGEHRRNRCQFSFACDGRSDRPREQLAWIIAQRISFIARENRWSDISNNATHYHANYVDPFWRASMQPTAQYGRHRFYRTANAASGG